MYQLKKEIDAAEAIVIGAGAGLSTSAGFVYDGDRFRQHFADFIDQYHFRNMYEGGFYPFDSPEEHWAYWSRYIYINRYMDPPKAVYLCVNPQDGAVPKEIGNQSICIKADIGDILMDG